MGGSEVQRFGPVGVLGPPGGSGQWAAGRVSGSQEKSASPAPASTGEALVLIVLYIRVPVNAKLY